MQLGFNLLLNIDTDDTNVTTFNTVDDYKKEKENSRNNAFHVEISRSEPSSPKIKSMFKYTFEEATNKPLDALLGMRELW